MLKAATFLGLLAGVFAFPRKSRLAAVAPSGAFRVDAQHSDAQMITDATTNCGRNKIILEEELWDIPSFPWILRGGWDSYVKSTG